MARGQAREDASPQCVTLGHSGTHHQQGQRDASSSTTKGGASRGARPLCPETPGKTTLAGRAGCPPLENRSPQHLTAAGGPKATSRWHTTCREQVSPTCQYFHGPSSERSQPVRLNINGLRSAQVFPLNEVSELLNSLSAHSKLRFLLPVFISEEGGPEQLDNIHDDVLGQTPSTCSPCRALGHLN